MSKMLSEVLSAKVVNLEHLKRIARIDAEDFSKLKAKIRRDALKEGKNFSDQYLEDGLLALKQYYAVAMLDPANAHAISAELDPFWHAHMLFSEEYSKFCDDVVGEYMHHKPLLHDDEADVDKVETLYNYTVKVLPELFTEVSPKFWPGKVERLELICMHKGNQDMYSGLQSIRLYEPVSALAS